MSEDKKISPNRLRKEQTVSELSGKINKASSVILTNYQGLTHKQLEELKKAVKTIDAEFVVTKNSLLKLALEQNQISTDISAFDNPTAVLFTYADIVTPLKELSKMIKALQLPTIKVGILEKQSLTSEQVLKLSTLPTKEVLLSQLVGALKSPIFGLHRALNFNIQKLVMTLGAVAKTKSQS